MIFVPTDIHAYRITDHDAEMLVLAPDFEGALDAWREHVVKVGELNPDELGTYQPHSVERLDVDDIAISAVAFKRAEGGRIA